MSTVTREPVHGFSSLALRAELLASLESAGYSTPTPIQAAFIPEALAGHDVIGQAQTGTGKTAAFLLPILNAIDAPAGKPLALILAPTRELVVQIAAELDKLKPGPDVRKAVLYGGQRYRQQFRDLNQGCHFVIGTPGRLIDHLRRGTLQLDRIRWVVLDEADRMLDIGFRPDIERILKRCPRRRQTFLLSATVPAPVQRLAQRYMRKPVTINLSPKRLTVENTRQTYMTVSEDRKFALLLKVIEREQPRQCIIFCQTKRGADALCRQLKKVHRRVATMHGNLQQNQRERILASFRKGRIIFLVATDVVSRGIDVTGISHIINYDLPEDPESYVHRIGRTGRMGADGVAIAFVTPDEGKKLTAIELVSNTLIEEDRIDGFEAYVKPEKESNGHEEPRVPVFGRRVRRYSRAL